jgi:heptosyltransferase-3
VLGDAETGDPRNWTLNLSASERTSAKTLLAPLGAGEFFAFSIGTKAQVNQWGEDRWTSFFRTLAAESTGVGLVMLGAADEAAISERVADAWRAAPEAGPVLNLCGACSPRVSAAVLERARMFFGHDSGPAHLAASTGTPLVQIRSSRTRAGQWFPHGDSSQVLMHWVDCGDCRLDTCTVEGKKCILSISVEEALIAAREHLYSPA